MNFHCGRRLIYIFCLKVDSLSDSLSAVHTRKCIMQASHMLDTVQYGKSTEQFGRVVPCKECFSDGREEEVGLYHDQGTSVMEEDGGVGQLLRAAPYTMS